MPKSMKKTITRLDIDEVANLLDEVESGKVSQKNSRNSMKKQRKEILL